ncbi:MAG: GNAT family N-acetyltransferase [Burkholderiaceae bacterium]|nr:GNAT family N-acetyltransferase [Burkholderiaceae bacterium]
MEATIQFRQNTASADEIARHLSCCDSSFVPPLSSRVDISQYASKIAQAAERFEAYVDGELIGLVAAYCNDRINAVAYITSVSVLASWSGKGVATQLLDTCIALARNSGMQRIDLEVGSENESAIALYAKKGFHSTSNDPPFLTLSLKLTA